MNAQILYAKIRQSDLIITKSQSIETFYDPSLLKLKLNQNLDTTILFCVLWPGFIKLLLV